MNASTTATMFLDGFFVQLIRNNVSHGTELCSTHQLIWFSVRTGDDKTKRVKCLSPEQKDAILQMTDPTEIPLAERRRQYNAINRKMNNPDCAKTFPAGLIEKWQASNTSEAKFLVGIKLSWFRSRVQVVDVVFIFLSCCHLMLGASQSDVTFLCVLTLRFQFLKCFLVDPSFQSMQVETWFKESLPQFFSNTGTL